MQGAQALRSEAYLLVRCNQPAPVKARAGCRAIPQPAGQIVFFQSHQELFTKL